MDKIDPDTLWLVYDGDCILCRSGAQGYRVSKAVERLQTLDARIETNHPVLREIHARGLDLNQGMVAVYGGQWRHGADAMTLLALLGSDSDALNRFNAWLFRSPVRARRLYPVLKAGRRLSLRLSGKGLI